jgi:Na+-translocating ferredoxin:NAD+ oxidoreductase RnfG subunit
MIRRRGRLLFLCLTLGFCAGTGAAAYPETEEQVFLTVDGALKAVFPDAERVTSASRTFTPAEKKRIEERLGWALAESSVTVYEGFKGSQPMGRAVITQEIGKFKPITFIVKLGPSGQVDRVEVLVYREAVGAEVRRQRFWGQFRGKTAKDGLRLNRDILNITGATMSVQAMTAGVRKVLVMLDELYPKP